MTRDPAPEIGQKTIRLGGVEMPVRANLGVYTKPISFIGLPVVAVPIPLEPLPIGIQIIAAPWREDVALRVAYALETIGVASRTATKILKWKQPDGDRPANRRRRRDDGVCAL
jgi:1-carboxybiuret hydrolase